MGNNPSRFKESGPNAPVEKVSWDEAEAFCSLVSRVEGIHCRLPTEAEWEYACRAGSTSAWCFGDEETELGDYAWYWKNSDGTTHPVGQKKPNAWGLHDMHGNVWEWCADWCADWHEEYTKGPATDPKGPRSGSLRMLRGGSWRDGAGRCRSADRSRDAPVFRLDYLGFRVAVSSTP